MELFQDYSNRQKTKVFSFILCLSLFFCLTTFSSCNNIGSFAKFGQDYIEDNMLVMVYVAGANSFRNEVIMDINSMERGLFAAREKGFSKLKVVALVDKDISIGSESWTGTRLYEVTPSNSDFSSTKINSKVIETASNSLGLWRDNPDKEEDMGNIKTLENFVLWATENYPYYKKHALILWNHGGGVYSDYKPNYFICTDNESGSTAQSLDNALYIGEISELLDKCFPPENKLEFLGFDACFMGKIEIAYQFRNSVKYMAFSPATEWGVWNYEYIFSQSDSCLSGKNFAINAVDGYKKAYVSPNNTLTALDLQIEDNMLVMVYVAGANSLRNEVIMDINSMEKGVYFANLKVVTLVDKDSSIGYESWTGTRLYEITPSNSDFSSTKINSKVIETASNSLGLWRDNPDKEEDMGNIKTLENFVLWATENYPYYKKHALILWNHGGGVYSDYKPNYFICTDDESGRTSDSLDNALYIGEISELLEKYYSTENALEFLGFDACFMGMYEVAYQFRNSVKYMAFSPATEWGGWNYEYIFKQSNSCLSGKNFAINVVDGYKEAYNSVYPNTMTAVDLQFASELKEKIDYLCFYLGQEFISDKTTMREKIEKVRNNSIVIHPKDDYNLGSLLLCYPYFELGSLLRCFANENPTLKNDNGVTFSTASASASFQVQDVLEKMILKTWLGGDYGNAYLSEPENSGSFVFTENIPYGISIFFSSKDNFYHHRFYTSEKTGSSGVFGYGCIEAANKTDNDKIDTWYELQCALYE